MTNIIIVVVLGLILGGAVGYMYKAKKKGAKCIGCAACKGGNESCCSSCGDCGDSCRHEKT